MKADNILQTIGNTPHVRVNKLFTKGYTVYAKLEKTNPGGSIKDRIALSMVEEAEKTAYSKRVVSSSSLHREIPALDWPW